MRYHITFIAYPHDTKMCDCFIFIGITFNFIWNIKILSLSFIILSLYSISKRHDTPPPSSLKNVNFFIHWPILIKFDLFEGEWGGGGPFIINFYFNYYWWTYENVMFQISSKSGSKWRILLLGGQNSFWGSQGGQSGPISKNLKILIQNGGFNPQPNFQHSSWIRKCLKIGDFWAGFRPPHRGWGVQFKK